MIKWIVLVRWNLIVNLPNLLNTAVSNADLRNEGRLLKNPLMQLWSKSIYWYCFHEYFSYNEEIHSFAVLILINPRPFTDAWNESTDFRLQYLHPIAKICPMLVVPLQDDSRICVILFGIFFSTHVINSSEHT